MKLDRRLEIMYIKAQLWVYTPVCYWLLARLKKMHESECARKSAKNRGVIEL